VSPDVFLGPLADKFFKLVLQLVARYASWVGVALEPAGPQGGEEAKAGGAGGLGPELSFKVHADIAELVQALLGEYLGAWDTLLDATVEGVGSDVRAMLREAVDEAAAALRSQQAQLVAGVAGALSDKCKESLKFVRGIIATYRMTNRPLPSEPSPYMASLLQPLTAFLDARGAALDGGVRAALVHGTAAPLTTKFAEVAEDLLKTVKQTDATLKRLKQRQQAPGADDGVSDADKIRTQLFLDIKEFGRALQGLGVAVEGGDGFGPYLALWKVVAPEGKDAVELL